MVAGLAFGLHTTAARKFCARVGIDEIARRAARRLGGALHGTVVEFVPGREFFVADLYWHPPEGDPIGPMALAARCTREGDATLLQVRQSGYDKKSERWVRYYDIMSNGWVLALGALKSYLEAKWT